MTPSPPLNIRPRPREFGHRTLLGLANIRPGPDSAMAMNGDLELRLKRSPIVERRAAVERFEKDLDKP
jgi:hypothetical protein